MEEHFKTDKPIDKKELNRVERLLNDHSKSVVQIYNVGLKHGHQKRALRNATVHVNGQVPVLRGSEKDHKQAEDKVKMRPIVNAMDGPKKTLSDIYSDLLTAVVRSSEDETLCYSTEELLETFERFNEAVEKSSNKKVPNCIVGSMDAVSLYPSLKANRSAEIIKEVVMRSPIVFENVDMKELGIYLRQNLSSEYIKEQGYEELLPTKMSGRNTIRNKNDKKSHSEYEFVDCLDMLFVENENDDAMMVCNNNVALTETL